MFLKALICLAQAISNMFSTHIVEQKHKKTLYMSL